MKKLALTFPLALLLSGCSAFSGLWLFEFETPSDDNEECTDSVGHNFTGATVVDDDGTGSYTSERTTVYSNSLVFGRLQGNGGGQATLVLADEVYPGTDMGDGRWVFQWIGTAVITQLDSHELGYDYSEDRDAETTETLTLTFAGDTVTGDVESQAVSFRDYSESDQWNEDVALDVGDRGQIPSNVYLEVDNKGMMNPAFNEWDVSECSDANCTLTVDSDCTTSWSVTGYRTNFGEDDYDAVQGAGQEPGT